MKIIKWLEDLYMKHHSCERNSRLHSETFINDYLTEIEYKCSICGKSTYVRFAEGVISKDSYMILKLTGSLRKKDCFYEI